MNDDSAHQKRDWWDKAAILSQIVLPFVIAGAGWWFASRISDSEQETSRRISESTEKFSRELDKSNKAFSEKQKKQHEEFLKVQAKLEQDATASQAESDRVALLLPLLASSNKLEQEMAIKVLLDLKNRGLFPEELGETLMTFFPDPAPAEIYFADNPSNIKVISTPKPKPKTPFRGLEDEVAELFPRIYFYVLSEEQKRSLMQAREALATDKNLYKRRKVFVMSDYNLDHSELRYFFESDKKEAEHIKAVLGDNGVDVNVAFSKSRPNSVRPRHFEVWMKRQ